MYRNCSIRTLSCRRWPGLFGMAILLLITPLNHARAQAVASAQFPA